DEMPLRKGKKVLGHASPVVDEIVNGWQISTIARYRSGLPSSGFYGGVWTTNFSFGAVAYPIDPSFKVTNGFDQSGNPSMFANTSASASNWLPMYAGSMGSRSAVRLTGMTNFDLA